MDPQLTRSTDISVPESSRTSSAGAIFIKALLIGVPLVLAYAFTARAIVDHYGF